MSPNIVIPSAQVEKVISKQFLTKMELCGSGIQFW